MDFIDQIKQFSKRAEQLQQHIGTEEATKTSIIMPFFQLLGYDVFNPAEFIPEFTADVGIKKGEKVDYAIVFDGKPMILIETKWCGENLQKHDSQLFRYFGTTPAKFAILTNGIIYRFYTDLDEQNKMDEKPFLEFNLLDIKENLVPELKKFQRQNFDVETIFNTASELKYTNQIKQFMSQQLLNPSDEFVSYILGEVYPGRKTQNVIDKFREVVKKSLNQFVNELMNERIKTALEAPSSEITSDETSEQEVANQEQPSKIQTTEEELEGYFIVRSILREIIPVSRVSSKDTESYFGILLDNNIRKWICRLQFNANQKSIIIADETKKGIKHLIESVDDIYSLKKELSDAAERYAQPS
ncbi:type I restriction endonuclease [Paradesulfitobacterium aromaticivorans]